MALQQQVARQGTASPPRAGAPTRPPRSRRWGSPALWLLALPALVVYVTFFVLPTLQAVQYSITDWDGFSPDFSYVGPRNFERLATGDDLFRNALRNTGLFMLVVVVAQTAVSLLLAVLLARTTRGSTWLRTLYFFPTILSSVSVAFVWRFAYDPNVGLLQRFLGPLGFESAYLGDPDQAIYWLALTQVWFHAGQMMVVFVAGLQSIPVELHEAAALDGAGRWQSFRYVTWPMLAPATAVVVAYTTIQSFKAFDLVLGLGGNPPRPALDVLSTRIYTTFTGNEFGYAAAQSIIFMVVIAAVTITQRRVLRVTRTEA